MKAFQKLLADRERAYGDRIKVRRPKVMILCIQYPNLVSSEQANGALCVRQARKQVVDVWDDVWDLV